MPVERKLAAIMFTDIAGYTALCAKDSLKTSELLKIQRDTLKPIVEKYDGSWMKEMGDGLLLIFESATSAVECSIAIQEATKEIEDLNLRIGIHQGEVIKQDGDVIGDDVNVTSRIEPFSAVGGVAISDKIYRDISSNQEFEAKYIGKPKLKGVSQKVEVYCITSHGLPQTDISKVSAKLVEESKFNILTLVSGILIAIGVSFWIAVGVFDVSFTGKFEVPSVGILMMENLGKEDDGFWSSGMTADLITKVAGAGLIRVAPIQDIRNIDLKLSIKEIATKLSVKYILTHSLLINDEGFDLWCKLENIEDGIALFSNKISEPINMTTQMVGKLANDIITSLDVKTKQNIRKVPTSNPEAYEFYLRAKHKYDMIQNSDDIELVRGLLNKAIELDDNLLIAKNLLGNTYLNLGDYDEAMEIYTSVLKQAEELGDKRGISSMLNNIGIVYHDKGDLGSALGYYEQSLEISEELGDKLGIGNRARNIGIMFGDKGSYDMAINYVEQSLTISEELDDKHGMGSSLNYIGIIHSEKGNYDKAVDYLDRALLIAEEVGAKPGIGYNLCNIGVMFNDKGDHEKAESYLEKSLIIQKEIGMKTIELETTTNLYLAYKYLGKEYDVSEIHTLFKEEENIASRINLRLYQLLEDKSYLESAYKQIQEKASEMDDGKKFISYPIPKAIVEEYKKVFKK